MEEISKYLEILVQKNEKLKEIFKYTKSKNFKETQEEVEHIQLYLRKRNRLFSELNIIEKNLKQVCNEDLKDILINTEVIKINKENTQIINNIITLDKRNKIIFEKIAKNLQNSIKNTKNAAKFNKNYFQVYEIGSVGSYFDSSK